MDPEERREHRRRAETLLGGGQEATRLVRTASTIALSDALS
jgi:deoxyribodipyrimidine photolyase-related protein